MAPMLPGDSTLSLATAPGTACGHAGCRDVDGLEAQEAQQPGGIPW